VTACSLDVTSDRAVVIRLAADENFNSDIVRGLLRRKPDIELVRIQDVGLSGADDTLVLQWAANEGRVLLTHDVATMTGYAIDRVRRSLPLPGVSVGRAIDDLLLIAECSLEGEWEGQIHYLPL
jgi:hypothetical protein